MPSSREDSAPHWSLDLYRDYLSGLEAPQGPFDPEGAWEHSYDVFPIYGQLHVTGQAWSSKHKGALRLKKEPLPGEDAFKLHVVSEVMYLDFGKLPTKRQRTTATIQCASDALATPLQWELRSVALSKEDSSPMPFSEVQESGVLRDGEAELICEGGRRTIEVGSRLTCNWSLLETVQRLSATQVRGIEFDMLEDLRVLRRGQHLAREAEIEVKMGGREVRLSGFCHTGEGLLPTCYWLDEQGRLLLAVGNVRAYIWHGGEA